ncbi:methyl-accepting chemotaxis protein [Pseudomonas graminis]|uniref:methyl-accepting chemotaxis protein n=1 Tax=Pseudomonas graminis TaxID=158627 RepID=UPI00234B6C37|nr:methyl-accepting chemotaxis protein [Pseudomonas graminis]MDC6382016.1 methyl-accepting chemotaxis protein [Pseudomonas graminis]
MKPSHPTRTTPALGLCLITLVGTLSYQQFRITHLTTAINGTAGKESLDAIQTKLEQFDERFAAVDQNYLTSNEDFLSGQQALSNRLDALQGEANQVKDRIELLDLSSASAKDVIILKASVDSVAAQLKDLQLRQTNSANAKPPSPSPSPSHSTQKTASRAKTKKSAPPPPFDVIGLEYRGGQEFLAIAPVGSNQLSQIQLVRPGDGVSGTSWRLRSVDSASASFDVAGVSQTIALAR